MTDTNQLPPLPEPHCDAHEDAGFYYPDMFTGNQMRSYALQARAQVQGEAEVVQQAAERYLWLRDGFHKGGLRKTRRPSDAPYVVNPQKSVLYGIKAYRGQELDRAIDEDRLNDLAQHIYEESLVNGDSRFSDPEFKFSDEFAYECFDKARAAMATTPQPAQAAQEEVTDEQIKMLIPCGDAWKYEVGFPEAIQFARAILALRPQAVQPMADEYVQAACGEIFASEHVTPGAYDLAIWRAAEAHHGITAQAKKEAP